MDEVHINDVVLTNPRRIELLSKDDVVLLPLWGESRVMTNPSFAPGSNRTLIVLYVHTDKELIKLICAHNMYFEYVGIILD